MSKAGSASLIDDVDFLAELEKFDPPPVANERIPSASIPQDTDAEWTWEKRTTFDDDAAAPVSSIEEPTPRLALGIGGFLLLMCLGGAAAALIFHDRVAQLFR